MKLKQSASNGAVVDTLACPTCYQLYQNGLIFQRSSCPTRAGAALRGVYVGQKLVRSRDLLRSSLSLGAALTAISVLALDKERSNNSRHTRPATGCNCPVSVTQTQPGVMSPEAGLGPHNHHNSIGSILEKR